MAKQKSEDIIKRVEAANQFIALIASRGRRFFEYVHHRTDGGTHTEVACFKRDDRGKLWFWNEWTCNWMYVSKYGPYKGFHHGGTLHSLVAALVDFIKSGNAYFHESFFNARHWAYSPEDMQELIEQGKSLGIIKVAG